MSGADVFILFELILGCLIIKSIIELWKHEKDFQKELTNSESCFPQKRSSLIDYCVMTDRPPKDKSKFWYNSENNMFYYYDFTTNRWTEIIK